MVLLKAGVPLAPWKMGIPVQRRDGEERSFKMYNEECDCMCKDQGYPWPCHV